MGSRPDPYFAGRRRLARAAGELTETAPGRHDDTIEGDGDLGVEWMDRFGDNLYNTYGSTEVAYATIADPTDLRAAPGTAGRRPRLEGT